VGLGSGRQNHKQKRNNDIEEVIHNKNEDSKTDDELDFKMKR
jgi:hypothetical protein